MRRIWKWFLMLNKRLYKKFTFVSILLLIPICALVLSYVAQQESGFLHIVLAQTNQKDAISREVVEDLLKQDSLILFTEVADVNEAIDMVRFGQADAAWVFADNMEEEIAEYVEKKSVQEKLVKVVVREESVFLRFTTEKLFSSLFEYCAKEQYIQFARTNINRLDKYSDEELLEIFESVELNENFFEYGTKGDGTGNNESESNYLMAPLRGLLGILLVLSGMAAMLYYMQDDKRGTFSFVKESRRKYMAYACLMIAILNVGLVVLLSTFLTGIATTWPREILALVLYILCCTQFCCLLREIVPNMKLYGAVTPLLTVAMIAICPVFFDFRQMQWLQLLFPPTYYINMTYNAKYLAYMVVYVLVCGGIICVLQSVKHLFVVKAGSLAFWNKKDVR